MGLGGVFVEEWGSCYGRVISYCQANGYPTPEWQELGSVIRVIFRRHESFIVPNVPINEELNDRQKWFISGILEGKKISARDIAEYWNVTEKTARRDIKDLQDRRHIRYEGALKNGRYVVVEMK